MLDRRLTSRYKLSYNLRYKMRVGGFEPPRCSRTGGFRDRYGYHFHHTRINKHGVGYHIYPMFLFQHPCPGPFHRACALGYQPGLGEYISFSYRSLLAIYNLSGLWIAVHIGWPDAARKNEKETGYEKSEVHIVNTVSLTPTWN